MARRLKTSTNYRTQITIFRTASEFNYVADGKIDNNAIADKEGVQEVPPTPFAFILLLWGQSSSVG